MESSTNCVENSGAPVNGAVCGTVEESPVYNRVKTAFPNWMKHTINRKCVDYNDLSNILKEKGYDIPDSELRDLYEEHKHEIVIEMEGLDCEAYSNLMDRLDKHAHVSAFYKRQWLRHVPSGKKELNARELQALLTKLQVQDADKKKASSLMKKFKEMAGSDEKRLIRIEIFTDLMADIELGLKDPENLQDSSAKGFNRKSFTKMLKRSISNKSDSTSKSDSK